MEIRSLISSLGLMRAPDSGAAAGSGAAETKADETVKVSEVTDTEAEDESAAEGAEEASKEEAKANDKAKSGNEGTEGQKPDAEKSDEEAEQKPKLQDRDTNHKFAEDRRMKDAAKKSYLQGVMDATGSVNPFTKKPIETERDVEVLKVMKKAEALGKDPVADFAEVESEIIAEKERDEEETKSKAVADREQFVKEFPDVNIASVLSEDSEFMKHQGKYLGKVPFADLYRDFMSERKESDANAKAAEAEKFKKARAASSEGSFSGNIAPADGIIPYEVLSKMTVDEYIEAGDKASKSYSYWATHEHK